ncbi:hypothetical protein NC651_000018 [Populus alba x Populus x berolinensis]|nr:hypothetical protein NC651_000018 [Populus alba x Populus x berolinensis]
MRAASKELCNTCSRCVPGFTVQHAFLQTLRKAQFFFLPFSINDPRVHVGCKNLTICLPNTRVSIAACFRFWNASRRVLIIFNERLPPGIKLCAKQCHSAYFVVLVTFKDVYLSHKDVGLPQVCPRPDQTALHPPHACGCYLDVNPTVAGIDLSYIFWTRPKFSSPASAGKFCGEMILNFDIFTGNPTFPL